MQRQKPCGKNVTNWLGLALFSFGVGSRSPNLDDICRNSLQVAKENKQLLEEITEDLIDDVKDVIACLEIGSRYGNHLAE